MGSRAGSLIVLVALGVIVVVAVFLVTRFAGDSESEQPAMAVSLVNDQPVLLGRPLEVAVRASSGEPLSIFTLLVDGVIVTQATPIYDPDQGRYTGVLFWTPGTLGFATLRIVATNTAGTQTDLLVRVDVTDDAQRVENWQAETRSGAQTQTTEPTTETTEEAESEEGADDATESAEQETLAPATDGTARILSPQDGLRYELGSGTPLDAVIETTGTGPLSSVLFYVTPVLADGSFGRSQLAFSANPDVQTTGGVYRVTVPGVEEWFPRAGTYDLQLVALTTAQERFEDLVRVAATEPSGEADPESETSDIEEESAEDEESAEAGTADLAILRVQAAEGGIAVTLINTGSAEVERGEVALSLIRTRDASLLGSVNALVSLAPEQRANVPLEVSVSEATEALIVLEFEGDGDASNNTFQVLLAASDGPGEEELDGDEPADSQDGQLEEGEDAQTGESEVEAGEEPEEATGPLADLAFLEAQFTDDGEALLTVVNAGEGEAGEFTIQVQTEAGEVLETIGRGTGAPPLAPRESEILAGSATHSGTVVIVLDPENTTAESNEGNNVIRMEVGG